MNQLIIDKKGLLLLFICILFNSQVIFAQMGSPPDGLKYEEIPFSKGHLIADVRPQRVPGQDGELFEQTWERGLPVKVLDAAQIEGQAGLWVQVEAGLEQGWIPADQVKPSKIATVTANVRLRLDPGIDSDVRGVIRQGSLVEILERTPAAETLAGKTAYWFRVETQDGAVGWVFGSYLTEINSR